MEKPGFLQKPGFFTMGVLSLSNPLSFQKPTPGGGIGFYNSIMYNHQPHSYDCPFCRIISQVKNTLEATEVMYQAETVTAFLSLSRWEKNPLDVLVVPNLHTENLYDLPLDLVPALHQATRAVALTLKAVTRCDGISTRQHNEPAGDQDVWHYHVHITPRFAGDRFYENRWIEFPETERLAEAKVLRDYMKENHSSLFYTTNQVS